MALITPATFADHQFVTNPTGGVARDEWLLAEGLADPARASVG
jgi:hypothetical protein